MGNKQVATTNIGIGPWTTYNKAIEDVHSGDILLLSARNFYGDTVRVTNRALWSNVGIIVKSQQLNEVYVMMAAVDRQSVYSCYHARGDADRSIQFGTMLQPLRSVLYNGLYNMAAYRKIAWRSGVDVESLMRENYPATSQEMEVTNVDGSLDDYITCRLLNLSAALVYTRFEHNSLCNNLPLNQTQCPKFLTQCLK